MKRLLDIIVSLCGLVLLSPVLLIFMYLVYRQDKHSPFYVASRVGKNGFLFKMFKLRSMCIDADKNGVDSTSVDDNRITPIGHKIRKYKLDEFAQLWNVLIGDMSLVGPRPNVLSDTDLYTDIEKGLLTIRPGITDFSSIIFSDEGDILEGKNDPDLSYNQLIRPWKSRLGLIYVENRTSVLDIKLIFYTVIAVISKQRAINWVVIQLVKLNVSPDVVNVSKREVELYPFPPPGSDQIVKSRII
jgi:lipopolysaccharide/colanic/teichoic acid biosynthesis glycosyltransferase